MQAGRADLAATQNADGGWGYAPGAASNAEATALSLLAIADMQPSPPGLASAAAFLQARRRPDGAFALSPAVDEPSWATPLAAVALGRFGDSDAVAPAVDWLLNAPAFVLRPTPAIYGYDTTLAGWPWTSGDYSFVEPTSAAVVFLKQQGQAGHARVREAVMLLHNRALPAGGWNYGESVVLGNTLLPAIVPTAMALLALADEPDDTTSAAVAWLSAQQGTITSLFSLGWASIAMNVLGLLDDFWTADVIDRWFACPDDRRTAMDTALCLLGVASAEDHPFRLGASVL